MLVFLLGPAARDQKVLASINPKFLLLVLP